MKKLLLLLAFTRASAPFAIKAAHEADINFATPDDQEFFIPESLKPVSINGHWYLQTTAPTLFHDYKTTISTLDGREVSSITYPIAGWTTFCNPSADGQELQYGHITELVTQEAFRPKKLGAGKYLVNFVKKFYQRKNIPFITLAACPAKPTPEDLLLTPAQRMDRLVAYYESLGFQVKKKR